MTTINLSTFKGKTFADVYVFFMKNRDINYKLIIARETELVQNNYHFINSMEFTCAAYAAQQLKQVATDFSYMVPSPYKSKPFEFSIETVELEDLVDVVFLLLCAYNINYSEQLTDFHFNASLYYRYSAEDELAAPGLIAIAKEQFKLFESSLMN